MHDAIQQRTSEKNSTKILSNIHIKICIKLMQTQLLTQLQRPRFEHIIGYNTFLSAIEI